MIMVMKQIKIQLLSLSGVLGIIVLWAAVITGMRRAHLGLVDARPLSYLGVYTNTAQLFTAGLLISSLLFICFAFFVHRYWGTNNRFLFYFLIGQIGQIIAAIAPYGANSRYKLIHTIAAFVLAFSLPFLIRAFEQSQISRKNHKLYQILVRLEVATFIIGMGIFTMTEGIAPLGEALPAIGFHIWIIVLTIVYFKTRSHVPVN